MSRPRSASWPGSRRKLQAISTYDFANLIVLVDAVKSFRFDGPVWQLFYDALAEYQALVKITPMRLRTERQKMWTRRSWYGRQGLVFVTRFEPGFRIRENNYHCVVCGDSLLTIGQIAGERKIVAAAISDRMMSHVAQCIAHALQLEY